MVEITKHIALQRRYVFSIACGVKEFVNPAAHVPQAAPTARFSLLFYVVACVDPPLPVYVEQIEEQHQIILAGIPVPAQQ